MSDQNLTEDDIVTWDDLPDEFAEALESGEMPTETVDNEDAPWIDAEKSAEITERKMTEYLHHIAHESCDTPECQQIREGLRGEMGGDPPESGDGSGADADDDGGNSDQSTDAEDSTDPTPDDDADPDDGTEADDTTESDDTSSGDDTSGGENTNIFGEKV